MDQEGMQGTAGAVFVQTNEPRNAVIVYERAADGRLARGSTVATGGAGSDTPHLPSQGSVVLSGDGRFLLITNAASDDVSVFSVHGTEVTLVQTVAAGQAPRSIAERDGLVYVLATGKPGIAGFRLNDDGLIPIAGGEVSLSDASADPAQIGFTPDGSALVVTERGTDAIEIVPVAPDGMLGMGTVVPSSGPTPYGFAFTSDGRLVVTEAFRAEKGAAAASSYVFQDGALTPATASVGNGRSEICWAVISTDNRYAFTSNFADGAVSRYAIAADGSLTLEDPIAGSAVEGAAGLRDEDLSADGRHLYAIDADGGQIYGWSVGTGGALAPVGSWDGVPMTVAGLAAS
ncbi:MAG: beta-propeller fold lactonase family protein [Actinomycetota bacterium]